MCARGAFGYGPRQVVWRRFFRVRNFGYSACVPAIRRLFMWWALCVCALCFAGRYICVVWWWAHKSVCALCAVLKFYEGLRASGWPNIFGGRQLFAVDERRASQSEWRRRCAPRISCEHVYWVWRWFVHILVYTYIYIESACGDLCGVDGLRCDRLLAIGDLWTGPIK